jgi:hypothetical protein
VCTVYVDCFNVIHTLSKKYYMQLHIQKKIFRILSNLIYLGNRTNICFKNFYKNSIHYKYIFRTVHNGGRIIAV